MLSIFSYIVQGLIAYSFMSLFIEVGFTMDIIVLSKCFPIVGIGHANRMIDWGNILALLWRLDI